jgi:hypothetical protein
MQDSRHPLFWAKNGLGDRNQRHFEMLCRIQAG